MRPRNDVKRMTPKEFRAQGYLQELNRLFLHPLGLALETVINEDGSEQFGGVWDCREDAEGIVYSPDLIDSEKAQRIHMERLAKEETRVSAFGSIIQKYHTA